MSARKPDQDGQGNSARQADFFRDLCRRNERRARLARAQLSQQLALADQVVLHPGKGYLILGQLRADLGLAFLDQRDLTVEP